MRHASPAARTGCRLAVLGLLMAMVAAPAMAGSPNRARAEPARVQAKRMLHVFVRAERLVIPPPLIEQVGAGLTRVQFPASGQGRAMALTIARLDGPSPRFTVAAVEVVQ